MTWGQWLDMLTLAGINGIMALGLYIQVRSGQLSLASGAFAGLGALASVRVAGMGGPFALGLIAGVGVGAGAGLIVAYPMQRLRGLQFAIATLAVSEIIRVCATNVPWMGGALGLQDVPIQTGLLQVALVAVLSLIWLERQRKSLMGMRLDGIREAELATEMIGIDARRHRVATFAAGAALLGIGGALLVHYVGFQSPESYGYEAGIAVLLYVEFGGTRTAFYPLLSAGLITIALETLRPLAENRLLVYALLLIIVTILKIRGFKHSEPRTRKALASSEEL